jgi:hypothetical protein
VPIGRGRDVDRKLVNRAHHEGRMSEAFNRLCKVVADKTVHDVDGYFRRMLDNASGQRCKLGPLPDLQRRSASQVVAEHDQRQAAVLAEAGVALETKYDRVRRDLLQRTAARFVPERTFLARAIKGR